jgi:hypothetical protein
LRKKTLVERILIDPATFAITFYDATGHGGAKGAGPKGHPSFLLISTYVLFALHPSF